MKISVREKRFMIVGGGIVILVIAYYLASGVIPDSAELAQEVESKRIMLLRQKELISQEDSYKARIAQYEQRLNQDRSRLLPGENPAAAAADLQKLLKDFADQSGVEISSRTQLPDQKIQDTLTKVSIQLAVSCSIDELVRFLAIVESHQKFLRVDELSVQQLRNRNRDEIRPQIKVAGYVAVPPPAAKPTEKPAGGN